MEVKKKKKKQKYQSRVVEEKMESELLWDEGKQKLGQAARGWEKWGGGRPVLSERYWKRSAAAADFFPRDFCLQDQWPNFYQLPAGLASLQFLQIESPGVMLLS